MVLFTPDQYVASHYRFSFFISVQINSDIQRVTEKGFVFEIGGY